MAAAAAGGGRPRALAGAALPLPARGGAGPAAGAAAPAQQQQRAGAAQGQGTFASSVVTLSAWAMGCGVLALPRVFAVCGLRRGLALLALLAVGVDASLRWTVACGRYSGKRGFRDNAEFFLGPEVGRAVYCGNVLLLFGGIVAVFVTAASLLACSAQEVLQYICVEEGAVVMQRGLRMPVQMVCEAAYPAPCMPRERVMVLVALLMFPLACQKSLHALRSVSLVSFSCLAYFFIVLLCRFGAAARGAALEGGGLGRLLSQYEAPVTGSFWEGPPIVLMALLCHTSILQLDDELRPEARKHIGAVIDMVILRTALPMYAMVGLGGYWLCGPDVSSNVLQDFGGDVWMAAARLMLGLMNMAKIPPATVALIDAFRSSCPQPQLRARLGSLPGRALIAAVVLAAGAYAASALGSLSQVLSLMGCTVGVLFSLCLPAALYASLLRDVAARRRAERGSGSGPLSGSLLRPLLGPREHSRRTCLAGAIGLPETRAAWLGHWLACATVFAAGLAVGALGLAQWASGPTV